MNVLFFLVMLAFDIVVALIGGWMTSNLWQWFIVPTFGLPSISVIQAVGLAIVVSFLVKRAPNLESDDAIETAVEAGIKNIIYMFLMFGFGFGFSFFM